MTSLGREQRTELLTRRNHVERLADWRAFPDEVCVFGAVFILHNPLEIFPVTHLMTDP
jgi:hypothetical protein